ncbi:MAG TPA: extracellular solute-binding protein [Firmicutes bacterium]|nr:extracellular solute-binding protein [Bacillota bacterium]
MDREQTNHPHKRNCIACHQPIAPEEEFLCPRCKKPHHRSCWESRGGCAAIGCKELAATVRQDQEKRQQLLREAEQNQRRYRLTIFAMLGLVLVLVVLISYFNSPKLGDRKVLEMMTTVLPYPEEQVLTRVVTDFNNKREDLFLRWQNLDARVYDQKLVVLIGARDVPDLFVMRGEDLDLFAEHGLLLNLDEYLARDPELSAVLDPETLGIWEGSVYGLPFSEGRFFAIHAQTEYPEASWEIFQKILWELYAFRAQQEEE